MDMVVDSVSQALLEAWEKSSPTCYFPILNGKQFKVVPQVEKGTSAWAQLLRRGLLPVSHLYNERCTLRVWWALREGPGGRDWLGVLVEGHSGRPRVFDFSARGAKAAHADLANRALRKAGLRK